MQSACCQGRNKHPCYLQNSSIINNCQFCWPILLDFFCIVQEFLRNLHSFDISKLIDGFIITFCLTLIPPTGMISFSLIYAIIQRMLVQLKDCKVYEKVFIISFRSVICAV